METISFSFDNIHGGMSTCGGLLQITADTLRCEYRTDLAGMGIKSESREASIRLEEIDSIQFKRGWFRGTAIIRPRSLKTLDRFPSSGEDCLRLYFKRRDRSRAEYLFSEINLQLSLGRVEFPARTVTRPPEPPREH